MYRPVGPSYLRCLMAFLKSDVFAAPVLDLACVVMKLARCLFVLDAGSCQPFQDQILAGKRFKIDFCAGQL